MVFQHRVEHGRRSCAQRFAGGRIEIHEFTRQPVSGQQPRAERQWLLLRRHHQQCWFGDQSSGQLVGQLRPDHYVPNSVAKFRSFPEPTSDAFSNGNSGNELTGDLSMVCQRYTCGEWHQCAVCVCARNRSADELLLHCKQFLWHGDQCSCFGDLDLADARRADEQSLRQQHSGVESHGILADA